ncbi:MHYT domain-containing protein [Pseudomonas anguilliseptica]
MHFLDQLFIAGADPSVLVLSNYDPLLVLMSLCIAVFTSGMALQLAGVARDSETAWWRQITILTGSLALGSGPCTFSACWRFSCAPRCVLIST